MLRLVEVAIGPRCSGVKLVPVKIACNHLNEK